MATAPTQAPAPIYVAKPGFTPGVGGAVPVTAAPSVGAAAGAGTNPTNTPAPQPSVVSTVTGGSPSATPATAYKDLQVGNGDPYSTALGGAITQAGSAANTPIDENAIYQQKLGQYQSEIDATNAIYANMLAQAKQQGVADAGSGRAIEARSGLLGSDFATADNAKITDATNANEASIQAEQAAKIGAILGTARSDAAQEIATKRAAQQTGLSTYIDYLGKQADRTAANTTKIAGSILSQGIDPSQIDPAQLKTIADNYGLTPGAILAEYNTQKTAKDAADAKALNDNSFNLGQGETRFGPDGKPIASVAPAIKTIGTPATGVYTQNADGSYTQTMAPVGGDSVQSLANELFTGNMAPSDLSKRSTGVGSYADILKATNDLSLAQTGKPFDIAKANTDYKFAQNPQTQNTLNYLGSLVGSADGSTPSNLDQLTTLSKQVAKPGFLGIGESSFPALNNAEQWSKLSSGDPTVAAYYATLTEVSDQVAKILQGGTSGGTSDAKLAQAQSLFEKGFTPDQITSVVGALKPLLQNRAVSMVKDNPYLSTYATQFGITQNNNKAPATKTTSSSGFGWDGS